MKIIKYSKKQEENIDLNNITYIDNGEIVISNTETIPGMFWPYTHSDTTHMVNSFKHRQKGKHYQVICTDIEEAIKLWNQKPNDKYIEEWLKCKLTLIINDIGIKRTNNDVLSHFIKYNGPLFGTSINLSGQNPKIKSQDIKEMFLNSNDFETFYFSCIDNITSLNPSRVIKIVDKEEFILR